MKSLSKLAKLAYNFKTILAQAVVSSGDIQSALFKAKLCAATDSNSVDAAIENDLINKVTPLLDELGIPASVAVNIKINVSAGSPETGPLVTFSSTLTPDDKQKSLALNAKLKTNFGAACAAALKQAHIVSPPLPVIADWLGITAGK